MRPARTRILATASAAVLALSGCSLQLEEPRGTPPAPAENATTGGTLTVGITAPGRIDPIGAATPAARMITQAMCDPLLSLDPVTRQVKPGLVKSYVEAENGSYLTFLPFHDLRMTDGRTLGGKDLAASLKALIAPYNGSPYRGLAAPFKGGVLGSEQKSESKINPLLAEGEDSNRQPAQLLNDFDVQVKAQPPNSSSARFFTDPALAPVSEHAMQHDITAFTASPACVGPYQLDAPVRSDAKTITLKRNPGYFAKNLAYTRGGAGWADRIVFRVYPSAAEALAAYEHGEVDIAPVPAEAAFAPASAPEVVRTDRAPATATRVEYVGIPTTADKTLRSPVVRRALSLALDRKKIAAAAGLGTAPASGFLPPSLGIEADDSVSQPGVAVPQCAAAPADGDVEQARRILQEAGISLTGVDMVLEYDRTEQSHAVMTEVSRQWNEAFGMKSDAGGGAFWSDIASASRAAGFRAPFRFSWGTDAVVPTATVTNAQAYFEALFTRPKESNVNWTGWSNEAFDKTVSEKLATTNDQRTQSQLITGLGATLCEQMPAIPVLTNAPSWLIRPGKLGSARSVTTGVDGLPLLRELYLTDPGNDRAEGEK